MVDFNELHNTGKWKEIPADARIDTRAGDITRMIKGEAVALTIGNQIFEVAYCGSCNHLFREVGHDPE